MDSMADIPSMQRANRDRSVLQRYLSATMLDDYFGLCREKNGLLPMRIQKRISDMQKLHS